MDCLEGFGMLLVSKAVWVSYQAGKAPLSSLGLGLRVI